MEMEMEIRGGMVMVMGGGRWTELRAREDLFTFYVGAGLGLCEEMRWEVQRLNKSNRAQRAPGVWGLCSHKKKKKRWRVVM